MSEGGVGGRVGSFFTVPNTVETQQNNNHIVIPNTG